MIIVPQSQIINSHIGFCGILIIFGERIIIMIINCHQGQHSQFLRCLQFIAIILINQTRNERKLLEEWEIQVLPKKVN